MPIELRPLRYFVAVAEELHFSRAAERLHISPPSLTQQIQNLERELSARLLLRTKRYVKLTDAGTRFLEEARATLQQAHRAELMARRAGRGEVGGIEIGFITSAACHGVLTETLPIHRRNFPLVSISIRRMETARQLEQLSEGRLDVGFLRPPPRYPVGILALIVARQPVVIALPKDHRLAKFNAVPSKSLVDETFVVATFESAIDLYQQTAAVGEQGGFVPRIGERAPDQFTITTMVAAGFGIAVVPESLARIQIPGVIFRPLTRQSVRAELAFAYRRDERSPAVKAFIQHVRTWSAQSRHGGD
jgi:DNA-binding transcriptional LysR family regulator